MSIVSLLTKRPETEILHVDFYLGIVQWLDYIVQMHFFHKIRTNIRAQFSHSCYSIYQITKYWSLYNTTKNGVGINIFILHR